MQNGELCTVCPSRYRTQHSFNNSNTNKDLTLEGPCIIFAIYIQSDEIHNEVALIKFLLALRCQLYMFRTVTVHPQELLVDTVRADYGTC